ncbi:hypothetical protein F4780DRAFT_678220 [Xylariomycetidae sp. FL0641]|nr:hypothetical protein F4780DRAFT_678220 [Xylariomycetidae sp. FL0641]
MHFPSPSQRRPPSGCTQGGANRTGSAPASLPDVSLSLTLCLCVRVARTRRPPTTERGTSPKPKPASARDQGMMVVGMRARSGKVPTQPPTRCKRASRPLRRRRQPRRRRRRRRHATVRDHALVDVSPSHSPTEEYSASRQQRTRERRTRGAIHVGVTGTLTARKSALYDEPITQLYSGINKLTVIVPSV